MKLPCTDMTDLFFSEEDKDIEAAKKICKGCPNQKPCLDQAMINREPWGVWGGYSPLERRRVRRWVREGSVTSDQAAEMVRTGQTRIKYRSSIRTRKYLS